MLENNQENLHESEVSPETVNLQEKEKKGKKIELTDVVADVENIEEVVTEQIVSEEVEEPSEMEEITSEDVANSENKEEVVVETQSQKVTEIPIKENQVSKPEVIDYSTMTMEQLLAELQSILNNHEVHEIKRNIDLIKKEFNRKHSQLLQETKKTFLEAGNESIDFHFDSPLKQEFDAIYVDYATKRRKYYAELDTTLKQNLASRTTIIDELKNLIDNGDSSVMYKDFKNLQQRWNEIGAVPRSNYNDTWKTYQHHVERFYDLLHINKDLRDLDFRHNLEEKQKLIVSAEELLKSDDIEYAFRELQMLHKVWKELGPVDREHRDEVWNHFSNLTKAIHDKRQDFYKGLKKGFDENVIKKEQIIEAINAIDFTQNKTHSDWQKCISKIEQHRKEFIEITNIPRRKNDELWNKFKEATRTFNKEKNDFYKEIKNEQQENLNLKIQLVEKAKALKDSEDIDKTAEILKKIQLDWKKIGHVPKKYSDKLWKEFKDACNDFFNRYHKIQDADNQEQLVSFSKKKEFYEQFKVRVDADEEIAFDELKEIINQWRALGNLPHNLKHIEIKFNKLLDKVFSKLSIDSNTKEMLKFKNIMESFLQQRNYRKLDNEQLFLRKKIDEISREVQQLENNISFISNVTEDNPLVKNVRKSIAKGNENLELWKEKLKFLASLDY
ncbi:MAG: DUF349 domain-containing protein [Flavobacteriaceae bacterium]|nr:DUF349 domain-containing protein [Flavobacteriaceae bacterium]